VCYAPDRRVSEACRAFDRKFGIEFDREFDIEFGREFDREFGIEFGRVGCKILP